MRRNSINLLALLLGTAVGIVAGLLFAPDKGANARKVLSYKIKNYAEKLQALMHVLVHTKVTMPSQAKAAGQQVVEETIRQAEQLLQMVNELTVQLEK